MAERSDGDFQRESHLWPMPLRNFPVLVQLREDGSQSRATLSTSAAASNDWEPATLELFSV